ncbi:MAG: hypothetical protein NVS4B9_22880 [Ktedonobacteraceae bacterium]
MDIATLQSHLQTLRQSLVKLVQNFPNPLLYARLIDDPSHDGDSAPKLHMKLMQQLLLLALNPYMARVLGLYYVDTTAEPDVAYDYYLEGRWDTTPCASDYISAGAASANQLAQGRADFNGIIISTDTTNNQLWSWTATSASGNYFVDTGFGEVLPWGGEIPLTFDQMVASITLPERPSELLVARALFLLHVPVCAIRLKRPIGQVDIQVAGIGSIMARSKGIAVVEQSFSSSTLESITLTASDPLYQPIDELILTADSPSIVIGTLSLHLLPAGSIGTRYTLTPVNRYMTMLDAPAKPNCNIKYRQAEVDPGGPTLVPRSQIEVYWTVPPLSLVNGTPTDPPTNLPVNQPIGYRAERRDTGIQQVNMLRRIISPAAQLNPANPAERIIRFSDIDVPDPAGLWTYRVAAFDAFGVLGHWSIQADPVDVERIAAKPTKVSVIRFDNSSAGGGTDVGNAWEGGTLTALITWSAASLIAYPDIASARVTVESLQKDSTGAEVSGNTLLTQDFPVVTAPLPVQVNNITWTLDPKTNTGMATLQISPAILAVGPQDASSMLILFGRTNGMGNTIVERYTVRPTFAQQQLSVVTIPISKVSRIVTNPGAFIGSPSYVLPGISIPLSLAVPLRVSIDQTTARGRIFVTTSQEQPFGVADAPDNPDDPEFPVTTKAVFTGQQWLKPPQPPIPTHSTHHEYYDPADFYGRASRQMPFATLLQPGISGYILQRAPVHSLFLADIKRRQHAGLLDQTPIVLDGGNARADLQLWIAALNEWLDAYNLRTYQTHTEKWLTADQALHDSSAQRALIEHFYNGLLDDELRALADVAENLAGFARVNSTPYPQTSNQPPLSDTIDGKGFGRVLYKLAATNAAGSLSRESQAVGPYYTRVVTSPRPPVLYRVQPKDTGLNLEWALDNNPDVAAYLVYRADAQEKLLDLRYFGPNAAQPLPTSALAQIQYTPQQWPSLSFSSSNRDARIIALVPDPRLFARDYEDSDMAEVVLPTNFLPDAILGVYRLSEFDATNSSNLSYQPQAFNYWRPPAQGGISQFMPATATAARVTGLRIGIGRSVPVVVVAQVAGKIVARGALQQWRVSFFDDPSGNSVDDAVRFSGTPLSSTGLNYYAVVAVDIFTNRADPSRVFAAQTLQTVQV